MVSGAQRAVGGAAAWTRESTAVFHTDAVPNSIPSVIIDGKAGNGKWGSNTCHHCCGTRQVVLDLGQRTVVEGVKLASSPSMALTLGLQSIARIEIAKSTVNRKEI